MNPNEKTSNTFIEWLQATPLRKGMLTTILIFAALALVAKTVLLFKEASHVGESDNYPQTISVSGKAEEFVQPDTLQFNVSVNEDGKDVSEATAKATDKVKQAIAVLKANGVEEKNIKTTNYSVSDKYEQVTQPCVATPMSVPSCSANTKIVGSTVYQTLEVKIQDISKNATPEIRGKIVNELAAANVKTDSFTFTVFDVDEVKARVRAEAIQKAKDDARVLARNLGVRLKGISGFSEQGEGGYNPFMSARAVSAPMMDSAAGAAPAPELPAGEQKITSNISITYLIK